MAKLNLLLLISLFCLFVFTAIHADNHRHDSNGVAPVTHALYSEECGMCHFAYPPGLLPEKSWEKLLSSLNLKNHFGEELEFADAERNQILTYLTNNSAEKSSYKRSKKIMKQISRSEIPLRITETKYIKNKHRKIPEKLIAGNDEIESLSNCNSCHKESDKGIFDDDTVIIPGYGQWDDD